MKRWTIPPKKYHSPLHDLFKDLFFYLYMKSDFKFIILAIQPIHNLQ